MSKILAWARRRYTFLVWIIIQSTIILAQIATVLDGSAPPPERAQATMLTILASAAWWFSWRYCWSKAIKERNIRRGK
jgi:hypothetical protein